MWTDADCRVSCATLHTCVCADGVWRPGCACACGPDEPHPDPAPPGEDDEGLVREPAFVDDFETPTSYA